jgi:hypothetical protein
LVDLFELMFGVFISQNNAVLKHFFAVFVYYDVTFHIKSTHHCFLNIFSKQQLLM